MKKGNRTSEVGLLSRARRRKIRKAQFRIFSDVYPVTQRQTCSIEGCLLRLVAGKIMLVRAQGSLWYERPDPSVPYDLCHVITRCNMPNMQFYYTATFEEYDTTIHTRVRIASLFEWISRCLHRGCPFNQVLSSSCQEMRPKHCYRGITAFQDLVCNDAFGGNLCCLSS